MLADGFRLRAVWYVREVPEIKNCKQTYRYRYWTHVERAVGNLCGNKRLLLQLRSLRLRFVADDVLDITFRQKTKQKVAADAVGLYGLTRATPKMTSSEPPLASFW